MRRRCAHSSDLGVCPMCKKVVEYGVSCAGCAGWFHATEQCCGDALPLAFKSGAKENWSCLNCAPSHADAVLADPLKPPAVVVELVDWRRAFRILANACAGCGRKLSCSARALRCCGCDAAYHGVSRCTGLSAELLDARLSASDAGSWRCPACSVRECGLAVPGSLVCADVAAGREPVRIPLVNEVDDETIGEEFEYAPQVVWRNARARLQRERLPRADWEGRCIKLEACAFLPATDESDGKPIRRDDVADSAAYNTEGCLLRARDNLFECNGSSSCSQRCYNRVVGRGVRAELQVFKTVGRGWGVRSQKPLSAGSFICEYTGEMLLDSDAEAAGLAVDDSYLFNLDGEEKGKVSKRRRAGQGDRPHAAALTADNPEMCVDASRIGSVARFVNHCCEPNLFVQSVFVEFSRRVHRIALFAARDIVPYEELTYDYGYVVGSVKNKSLQCLCGAQSCRGYLF